MQPRLSSAAWLSLLLLFGLSDGAAEAQPIVFAETGNAYDLVTESVDWPTARQLAESMTYRGVGGRLATINSQAENDFLLSTFGSPEAWIGGFQEQGSAEPDQGFRWITEEPFDFTNWGQFDPGNNSGDPLNPNEQYVTLVSSGFWNDLAGPPVTTSGYYVEFVGVPEPSSLTALAAMFGLVTCRGLRRKGRGVTPLFGVVALLGLVTTTGEVQAQITGSGTITGTFTDDIETTSGTVVLVDEFPAAFDNDFFRQVNRESVVPFVTFPDSPTDFPVSNGAGTSVYGWGLDANTRALPAIPDFRNPGPTRVFIDDVPSSVQELFDFSASGDFPGGTVQREYDPSDTQLAFSSDGFEGQPKGETFVAGLIEFTNGVTLRGTDVPSVTLTLETLSDDVDFVQTLELGIEIITTTNILGQPIASADFIYFPERPELGSFRVFENESATVEVLAEFNSLDLIGFGAVSDPSVSFVSPSIDEIPEPSGISLAAIAAAMGVHQRRMQR